jgi:D-arginine dehydrogenase
VAAGPAASSDFLIVGGGIAGAAAGYFLAQHGRVRLLEREQVPGYHATGRSAALFSEYYGPPVVRSLTAASRGFLSDPPPGFDTPLLAARGVLALRPVRPPAHLTLPPDTAAEGWDRWADACYEQALADGLRAPVPVAELAADQVQQLCPALRRNWYRQAMYKPGAMDIDVNALHQGLLRGVRAHGGELITGAAVSSVQQRAGGWRIHSPAGQFTAPVLVNAAGAWADELAIQAGVAPLRLRTTRRTACLIDGPDAMDVGAWPMVTDVTDTFYVKPESGRLLLSPADSQPVGPSDARPQDLDVAAAVERVNQATVLAIKHVVRAWAGLRTFAEDGLPVIGPAGGKPGFFWLAALGGYGIQLAPAAGQVLADAVLQASGQRVAVPAGGPDPRLLHPARLAA